MSSKREVPRIYRVQARDREPLIAFMVNALEAEGCRIIHEPEPDTAPFRITFETPTGERLGIITRNATANCRISCGSTGGGRAPSRKYCEK